MWSNSVPNFSEIRQFMALTI